MSADAHGRIHHLAAAIQRFLTPGDPLRARLLKETPHFAPETLSAGLEASLGPWDEAGIAALWSASQAELDEAVWPELAVVVLGGVLPPSHVQAVAYPWLLGAEVIVKHPSIDPLFPQLLAEALGEGVTVVKDLGLGGLLRRADAVIAVGDDDSVRAIASDVAVATPLLGFGHRSAADVVLGGSTARARPTAADVARDIGLFDQLGCLSPREVLVVGGPEDARHLAGNLASELARLPARRSLGVTIEAALRTWVEERRLEAGDVLAATDLQWGVAVSHGDEYEGTPGGRHVIVRSVPHVSQLCEVLTPLAGHLSAVGVAGGELDPGTVQGLVRLGASRIVPAGQLQSPPPTWPHDGRRPLSALCRYFSTD